jgi:thiol-disulfide isomerase/thioredoxin
MENRKRYAAWVVVLLLVFAQPLLAGGSREAEASAPRPAPGQVDSSPAESAGTPGTPTEVTDAAAPEAASVALDDETSELVTGMGMMPFEQKIPSEDFELALLSGGRTSLGEHQGKVVFLNFWATWCPPCREEMPSMQALYDELADDGLEILAVNVLESEETAAAFIEEQGFTYPVLMDTNGRVMMRYGVRAYPTTYLIDREGYVIGARPGFHDWASDDVITHLRSLLETE